MKNSFLSESVDAVTGLMAEVMILAGRILIAGTGMPH